MTAGTRHPRLVTLNRHLVTQYGRDRVGRALFEVVVEGMELGPCGLPASDDREWLRGALALPLQEATDVALEVLAWRVSQVLEGAPEPLRDRFDRRHADELAWG